jgi:CheY-like chemotaxis protein
MAPWVVDDSTSPTGCSAAIRRARGQVMTKPAVAPGTQPADADLADLADAVILLVDDNVQNLELMQAYLESLPCRIRTAIDGLEAIKAINDDPPDLILLDVMMPRMSGFELCQKIKANPSTRDIVVIMVTALHEVGDFERAVECGTDDFLTKPVNKLELLTRVRSLLRVRLLKRRLDQVMSLRQRVAPDERDRPQAGQKLE